MIVDGQGTPLAIHTTPANVRDEQVVTPMLEKLSRPETSGLQRPVASLYGDRGYGFDFTIRQVSATGIEPVLSERDEPKAARGSGLGVVRRVVEQTLANLGHCRRIKLCYEKCGDHFQAFNELAAALLCYRRIVHYKCGL